MEMVVLSIFSLVIAGVFGFQIYSAYKLDRALEKYSKCVSKSINAIIAEINSDTLPEIGKKGQCYILQKDCKWLGYHHNGNEWEYTNMWCYSHNTSKS